MLNLFDGNTRTKGECLLFKETCFLDDGCLVPS